MRLLIVVWFGWQSPPLWFLLHKNQYQHYYNQQKLHKNAHCLHDNNYLHTLLLLRNCYTTTQIHNCYTTQLHNYYNYSTQKYSTARSERNCAHYICVGQQLLPNPTNPTKQTTQAPQHSYVLPNWIQHQLPTQLPNQTNYNNTTSIHSQPSTLCTSTTTHHNDNTTQQKQTCLL